jgi:K(+)-stimulated pyrophosphate-energized sodium pump
MNWPVFAIIISLLSYGVAAYFYRWVKSLPTAEGNLADIGKLVRDGAFTFLKIEYRVLSRFVGAVVFLIVIFYPSPIWLGHPLDNLMMAGAYIAGSVLSATAGYIGISIATIANVKAATAARKGLETSFMAGFRGGAVMGMAVVGTSLAGASILYLLTQHSEIVLAFSFGASSLALFAKAGGGIFTKTADISADLTGKVELGIPEDDPRNPAVIADNVGDNVGDVAGMGADLFDSNVAAIAAAIILAAPLGKVDMVFAFGGIGLLSSIIGVLMARVGKHGNPGRALNTGTYLTTVIFAALSLAATLIFNFKIELWLATFIGLLAGAIIGFSSDLFTSDSSKAVARVAKASNTGPAFTIITGFSYGLLSSFPSILGIAGASLAAYKVCEPLGAGYPLLGISLAALGMLSIVGMIISNDAYGPIVDNARGLAEMGGLGEEVLEITDQLDSAGNTAKAITKGFAIGAAGLTVIALLAAYQEIIRAKTGIIQSFSILDPLVFFGMLAGVAVPAVFSAMLMMGVGRNAERLVEEIHRQFDEIIGLREGLPGVVPDYNRCIDIATIGAIKELIPAGLVTILATMAVGFIGGVTALGGFLAGNITSGLLLALVMSNAGGLWDNAKKFIESGHYGGKGSPAHKAAVIGDTVGDPFKDTAGPSINTQITVVSLVASLSAGIFMAVSIFK